MLVTSDKSTNGLPPVDGWTQNSNILSAGGTPMLSHEVIYIRENLLTSLMHFY